MAKKPKDGPEDEKPKMPKFPESYEIPESLIRQLQEHSLGFMLVALDNNGQMKMYERFDNLAMAEAIRYKLGKILNAQQEISDAMLFNSLVPEEMRDDDELE